MNDQFPKIPAIKAIEIYLSEGWKKISKPIQITVCLIITFLVISLLFLSVISAWQKVHPEKKTEEAKLETNENNPELEVDKEESKNQVSILGASDCITSEWENIVQEDWLQWTWFSISNGVWTIGSPETENDAAIYYNIGCVGGTLVDYEVIPRLKDYLNINVYQRGQLRWEIGGGDRRSIRLWKNTVGCNTGETKSPEIKSPARLKEYFLPDHDEILVNQNLVIHSSLFYLPNGMIRSEIWLTYSSKNGNGNIVTTPRETYCYDFEVGSVCNSNHFPDIYQEPYQPGIGLQKSQSQPSLLPRVEFNKFRITPFDYFD